MSEGTHVPGVPSDETPFHVQLAELIASSPFLRVTFCQAPENFIKCEIDNGLTTHVAFGSTFPAALKIAVHYWTKR